jgi:integrase
MRQIFTAIKARLAAGRRRKDDAAPRNFGEAATRYLKARTLSRTDVGFVHYLIAEIGHRPIADVRQADIDGVAAKKAHLSAGTLRRHIYTPASAILHYAADNDWAPLRRLHRPRMPEPETRRPAPGVEDALLAATDGRQRLLILLLFRQGWRISETLGLRWEKIDFTTRAVSLYIRKVRRWKTIYLAIEARAALAEVAAAEGVTEGRVFTWSRTCGVYRWLRPLCRRLGVRFTPHMARHEFASARHEAGANARDLVDMGTWTRVESTYRYIRPREKHVRELLNRRAEQESPRAGDLDGMRIAA